METQVFNQLIQQHSKGAFAIAIRMLRCSDEAFDVVQDACCALLRQSSLPQDSNQFRALLFTIVRNKVIDRIRSQKVRQADSLDEQLVESSSALNPDSAFQQQQIQRDVSVALSQLGSEHREIILLKDWQGFSYAEIATILGIESGTVMSRLHRARMSLREKLSKYEGTHHD